MKGRVEVRGLSVRLPGFCLANVDFAVEPGEFFLLLGPTGSGKTLTLEAIAGLMPVDRGSVHLNGRDVTRLPPERRSVGIVYQDYALFPHLSVMDNICYGMRYRRPGARMSREWIAGLMYRAGIEHLVRRSIDTLSGGEKQRVALMRALAIQPSVLLLDEPLSALDPGFREDLQRLLKALCRETGTTFVMVTHDVDEARFLGERAAVLHGGRIEQSGPVARLFQRPATVFVARFTGIKNIFPAVFAGDSAVVNGCEFRLAAPAPAGAGFVAVRGEHVRPVAECSVAGCANRLTGQVIEVVDYGPYAEITVQASNAVWRAAVSAGGGARICPVGRTVCLEISPEALIPVCP